MSTYLHPLKQACKAVLTLASASLLGLSTIAHAAWPERPVQMVVPFPAGSSPDILARAISEPLSKALKQPVIIDNRPGAGGNIGTRYATNAKPDGYTILLTINGPIVTAPTLYKNTLGYDPLKDLAPVTLLGTSPNVLIVPASSRANDFQGFIRLAQEQAGALNYGSVGPGSSAHLAMAMLEQEADIQLEQIPYTGFPQIITALIGGDLHGAFMVPGIAMPQVESGAVRALAVTSLEETDLLPGMPTVAEQGLSEFEAISWDAIFVPAGTPQDIIERLNTELRRVLALEDIQQKFRSLYFTPEPSSPAELHEKIVADQTRWNAVIERLNLTLQ